MSWHGISTVARLELRQRARASKWVVVLAIWFAVIALVSVLSYLALNDPDARSGAAMYDVVVFFVLGLGMLVVPSLTATSINGDREHGVLATLQTTLLTSADLVLGKLLARGRSRARSSSPPCRSWPGRGSRVASPWVGSCWPSWCSCWSWPSSAPSA